MKALLFISFILAALAGSGQNTESPKGTLEIVQDASIDMLVDKHRKINKLNPGIEGYRVQIFFDSGNQSKSRAFEVYSSFLAKYPGRGAYITFQEPNFKVRAGNFRTHIEAEGFMRSIITDYSSALVVKDNIEFPSPP